MIWIGILITYVMAFILYHIYKSSLEKYKQVDLAILKEIGSIQAIYQATIQDMGERYFYDYVGIYGQVRCEGPDVLETPITHKACLHYRIEIQRVYEEKYRETEEEEVEIQNLDGKKLEAGKRRWKYQKGREVIFEDHRSGDFYIDDETGQIKVEIEGAEILSVPLTAKGYTPIEMMPTLNWNKYLPREREVEGRRTLGYEYREWSIPEGQWILAIGEVSEYEGVALAMRRGEDKPFIVTPLNKAKLSKRMKREAKLYEWLFKFALILGSFLLIYAIL